MRPERVPFLLAASPGRARRTPPMPCGSSATQRSSSRHRRRRIGHARRADEARRAAPPASAPPAASSSSDRAASPHRPGRSRASSPGQRSSTIEKVASARCQCSVSSGASSISRKRARRAPPRPAAGPASAPARPPAAPPRRHRPASAASATSRARIIRRCSGADRGRRRRRHRRRGSIAAPDRLVQRSGRPAPPAAAAAARRRSPARTHRSPRARARLLGSSTSPRASASGSPRVRRISPADQRIGEAAMRRDREDRPARAQPSASIASVRADRRRRADVEPQPLMDLPIGAARRDRAIPEQVGRERPLRRVARSPAGWRICTPV